MFNRNSLTTMGLEKAINDVLEDMDEQNSTTDEYAKNVEQLERLYRLKETDSKKQVSPDTLAIVTGNLVGILLIVGHERANVVTSKALGFVMKAR